MTSLADHLDADRTRRTEPRPGRPEVSGKLLTIGGRPYFQRGATYGAFEPDEDGNEYTDRDRLPTISP